MREALQKVAHMKSKQPSTAVERPPQYLCDKRWPLAVPTFSIRGGPLPTNNVILIPEHESVVFVNSVGLAVG